MPILPLAPVTFSTTTDWPSTALIRSTRMRATVSFGPPGANGTTIVIGREGYGCAAAAVTVASSAKHAAATIGFFIQGFLPLREARARISALLPIATE